MNRKAGLDRRKASKKGKKSRVGTHFVDHPQWNVRFTSIFGVDMARLTEYLRHIYAVVLTNSSPLTVVHRITGECRRETRLLALTLVCAEHG
jgi:hypothetical protein